MFNEADLKKRVSLIKTMCFFDIFDFALTKEELCDYMLDERWTNDELTEFVNHEKFVIENNFSLYLEGRALNLNIRRDKEHRARKLILKAQKYIKYMRFLPFIRMIGICNGLAFYDAEKGSDIDIFIITRKKRLFTARLFAFLFTQLAGIRRHGKKIKGRFCLSFIVSEESMNLENLKISYEDIYFIYWMRLMQPVIGYKTYLEFLENNKWIQKHFNYKFTRNSLILDDSKFQMFIKKILEFPFNGGFGDRIEGMLGKIMKKRAEKKASKLENRSGIIISDSILKFHDIDMREKFNALWKKRISMFEKYFIPHVRGSGTQDLWQYPQTNTPSEVHSQDIFDMKSEEPERR